MSGVAFAISLILQIFSAYYVLVALFGFFKTGKYDEHPAATRFAVLVPARNEAKVIGEMIESLKQQDYPDELYEIYIVANNCTDDTVAVAKEHGAQVFECTGKVRCKGDALGQAVDYLMEQEFDFDAFCVFDADNLVDRQFLAQMNNAFMGGVKVAKGRNEAKNPYDTWISGCYAIYFRMANVFYNRARANLRLSARLVGTGFAVRRDVIYELGGWATATLTEDAEFAAQLAERGIRVAWVPKALSYDEEPNSFMTSLKQRKRWCSGLVEVAKIKLPALFRSFKTGPKALKFDAILFQFNSFLQAATIIPAVLNLIVQLLPMTSPSQFMPLVLTLAGGYIGGVAMATGIALFAGKWDRRIIKSIFTYPIFLVSWLPLQVLAIIHTTKSWEEIEHNRNVSLSEVA